MFYDIRRLDIYRKVPKDLTQPTYTGACISIVSCIFMTFLFVSELISFLSVEIISEMYVADEAHDDERVSVNIDVILPQMDCKYLGLDIQDNTGRHEVGFVDNVERVPYNGVEGCIFKAKFKVNKVPGNFHISTHASREQPRNPNMTHIIRSVTFGDTFTQQWQLPGSFNPLAGKNYNSTNLNSIEYYLKVVPTVVQTLSGELVLHAHQYTYAHREMPQFGHGTVAPVVWFRYDLSPITVKYTLKRKPLYSFLTTVCAIVGGTFTVAGIFDSVLFTASNVFKKAELGKLG